jgi:hypothetical protein
MFCLCIAVQGIVLTKVYGVSKHCVLGCTRVRGIIISTYCYVMCGLWDGKYVAIKHVSEEVALRVLLCCSQELSDRLVKQGAGSYG